MKKRVVIILSIVCAAGLLTLHGPTVRAQTSLDDLVGIRDALMKRMPAPTDIQLATAADHRQRLPGISVAQQVRAARNRVDFCTTHDGNRISSLVAYEDNLAAAAMDGFVLRDRRGRRTRPWRALRRSEHRSRGVVVQRPLLVFVETPETQQDFSQPWFGPVRFDRPGFPTTKQKIAEQVFGKNFDHRDPESVAGFYYRESGGKLVIKGDASSIFSVTVPYASFDPAPMVEAILAQVDPVVDFSKRADQFGWADPIFIMSPFSIVKDVYEPDVMGDLLYIGYGPSVYDDAPAFTNDVFPDGTHVALSSVAISMVGFYFGSSTTPGDLWFGLPTEKTRTDYVSLYAHEYGHAIGLGHMMSEDYALKADDVGQRTSVERFGTDSISREWSSGFASTIMNYSSGSGFGPLEMPVNQHKAGLDPVNRAKLGWGNVAEITLTDDRRPGPEELVAGGRRRVNLVEHLGIGPHDPRPQILKVNLPPRDVALFPRLYFDGSNSGYWHPGATGRRMVWSGRTLGGSRTMETTLRIPADVAEPVLSFWTKYGAHSGATYPAGYEFGWVQISTDHGQTWTSLAGQTTTTTVAPGRGDLDWFGEDLGAPAFTGDSRPLGPNGWVFEQIPLPVAPGRSVRLRFNFSGYGLSNEIPAEDYGWWIDDVYLGTPGDPTRHLVSSFEEDDERRWTSLLKTFDQGFGFVVVEETTSFPQAYYFELRGSNPHDEAVFTDTIPKDINGRRDDAIYAYDKGVVGYYVNYYSGFAVYPFQGVGSANHTRVPLERLRRAGITHPFVAQANQQSVFDFGAALAAAFNPASGLTIDDVAFLSTFPTELFLLAVADAGFVVPALGSFPTPNIVSVLDANPTYRPFDVMPANPMTLFPNRPPFLWPNVLGAPGGWPKSMRHGVLGLNDPTTVRALGQPFLARDAAFHPDRNPVFDDSVDYRGAFFNEFINWHAPTTAAAFGSPADSERISLVVDQIVPVSPTESIQQMFIGFCHQNAAGTCVIAGQGVKRPWIEQVLYQRLAFMVWAVLIEQCPIPPEATTLATKPAWDAFNTCVGPVVQNAHVITNQLLDAARNVGNNPFYTGVNAYGSQGTLSPGLWSAYFLGAWGRAKAPAPLPSFGLSMEVEHITSGHTPVATLTLRRQ